MGTLLRGAYGRLLFVTFLLFAAFALPLPLFPRLFLLSHGTPADIGVAYGMFTLAAVGSRLLVGRFLSGARWAPLLLSGLLGLGFSQWALVAVHGVVWLWGLRVLGGFFWGLATVSSGTAVTWALPPGRLGEGMGYYNNAIDVALGLFPFLGTWLGGGAGMAVVFGISALLAVAAVLPLWRCPVAGPPAAGGSPLPKGAILPSFLGFLTTVGYGALSAYLPLLREGNLPGGLPGWALFYPVMTLFLLLVRGPGGRLYDRRGPRLPLGLAYLALLAGLPLLVLAPTLLLFLLGSALYAVGFGLLWPALMAWTIDRVGMEAAGGANALVFATFDVGVSVGALGTALLVPWLSLPQALALWGLFSGGCLVFLPWHPQRQAPAG